MAQNIAFNEKVRLILADVDETIADVYRPADPLMIAELQKLLAEKRVLFFVSGGGLQKMQERITNHISVELRHRIIIAHCSGAEVWGFEPTGDLKSVPYYGLYEGHFTEEQKSSWRQAVQQIISKFHLQTYPTQPKPDFIKASGANPLAIMLADRGPQITFEFVNSINLTEQQKQEIENLTGVSIPATHGVYDLRVPVMEYARDIYKDGELLVTPKLGGTMALDSVIEGVDKTRAIKFVLEHDSILSQLDINHDDISAPETMEIWGDKFGQKFGGPDFEMCRAVAPEVRAIDFRNENPEEIPQGYNIQIWTGSKNLHHGLLEYLQSRN